MTFLYAESSRRTVLKLALNATLLTTFPSYLAGCGTEKLEIGSIARHLIETLDHPAAAREIGLIYLAKKPDRASQSATALVKKLLGKMNLDSRDLSEKIAPNLQQLLDENVRQDFVEENVVVVNGWMLSETESLLCALSAVHSRS